jgi:malate synthase
VTQDKKRESQIGHDGCWVSHPFFIGIAKAQFTQINQLDVLPSDIPNEPELLPLPIGPKTLEGLRQNIRVGIAYQEGWTRGQGCIAFENLMEDLATLEISRAQVWQWLHHRVILDDQTAVTPELVERLFDEECEHIIENLEVTSDQQKILFKNAKQNIKQVFLKENLSEFFTQQ